MATEIIMPQMGFDMKEGTLVRWLKKEGDPVIKGEAIVEIETDKANVEVEAFASGVLRRTLVKGGTTVPVGHVIGVIAQPDEVVPEIAAPTPSAIEAPQVAAAQKPTEAAPAGERLPVSPIARKVAEETGVDLALVTGTGPGGRITKEDVLAYAEKQRAAAAAPRVETPAIPPAAPSAPGGVVPLTRMRQAIARNMSRSKREIPHFYVTAEVDMTEALRLRQQLNDALEGTAHLSINDMIVKAAARALAKHPQFNASHTESGVQLHNEVNIGIAIALPEGLMAPAILDCAGKSLVEIARASKSLAERAKGGTLHAQEYTGATFTVTNLGMYEVTDFAAIINPPQSASLAVGAVRKQPVVRNGEMVVAEMMKVTLSIDHRVADGAQAALFLSDLRALLQNPARLLV